MTTNVDAYIAIQRRALLDCLKRFVRTPAYERLLSGLQVFVSDDLEPWLVDWLVRLGWLTLPIYALPGAGRLRHSHDGALLLPAPARPAHRVPRKQERPRGARWLTSLRKRKAAICRTILRRVALGSLEDRLWDQMQPVRREFGSPNFERLMEEDYRARVGAFDPALAAASPALQRRRPGSVRSRVLHHRPLRL
ncbi:hypothetical protein Mpe_B0194 (plasmid) [Methylibium petroleiphilum PM1]|uniref:Uncharacterized protein n=1 Tax=Methylibium petroleiphilum (strain ATCC BAA-1232 / LMG 22953 / PM1) TaxID=420662 RepID=A2SF21_METPP|nr:hypothetical protein Mpe_A1197 [Methylibium petroleiphilum PM1]ABM96970.1 hypothetical protein Mpe_B0194 [Methylibium petroleiphilum PM1]